jgi:hypothetical protein
MYSLKLRTESSISGGWVEVVSMIMLAGLQAHNPCAACPSACLPACLYFQLAI